MEIEIFVRKVKNGKVEEKSKHSFDNGSFDSLTIDTFTNSKNLANNTYYCVKRDGVPYFDKSEDGAEDFSCKLTKSFDGSVCWQDRKELVATIGGINFPNAFEVSVPYVSGDKFMYENKVHAIISSDEKNFTDQEKDTMYEILLDGLDEKYKNGIINIKQYVDKKIELEFKKRGL